MAELHVLAAGAGGTALRACGSFENFWTKLGRVGDGPAVIELIGSSTGNGWRFTTAAT